MGGFLTSPSMRKSPNQEELGDLLFTDLNKGVGGSTIVFPIYLPCPWECSKHLLRACCYFCGCWDGSRGPGSGLLCVRLPPGCLAASHPGPKQATQGQVGNSTFPRGKAMLSEAEELLRVHRAVRPDPSDSRNLGLLISLWSS